MKKHANHIGKSKTRSSNSIATQTDTTSINGKGRNALDLCEHKQLFTAYDQSSTPLYRENLNLVFDEEFIELNHFIDFVKDREWEKLKAIYPFYNAPEETYQLPRPDVQSTIIN